MKNTNVKKKILVTGSDGFIAKNLILRLSEAGNYTIIPFSKKHDLNNLSDLIEQSDFIFHLAGENRPKKKEDFVVNNVHLTKEICKIIKSKEKKVPIVFSSSIHALSDSEYGKSKLDAEKFIADLIKTNKGSAFIFRLPGIFGKWCKPNYNSVVATFCHNIANGKEVEISDSSNELTLCYIDDLVSDLINTIDLKDEGLKYKDVTVSKKITLGALHEMIISFRKTRDNHIIGGVGSGFERALYSTYISYLPPSKFSYSLKENVDERGSFVEMLKTKSSGQFSYFTSKPGITRGEHYHHTKTEKFLVLQGKARFRFRNIISNEEYEIFTDDRKPIIVETIPGWSHDIKNIGDDILIVMLWANEIFDADHPDTYSSKTF